MPCTKRGIMRVTIITITITTGAAAIIMGVDGLVVATVAAALTTITKPV